MQKLKNYFSAFLNIADICSFGILCVIGFICFMGKFIDPFDINGNNYDERIKTAYAADQNIFFFLSILIFLFLIKKKYPKIVYAEWIMWGILFLCIPYLWHQIPSVAEAYNQVTANTGVLK